MKDLGYCQRCVVRAGEYLRVTANVQMKEAMLDLNFVSKQMLETDNEVSKLRVKVARVQRRLRVLAADANDLAQKLK